MGTEVFLFNYIAKKGPAQSNIPGQKAITSNIRNKCSLTRAFSFFHDPTPVFDLKMTYNYWKFDSWRRMNWR